MIRLPAALDVRLEIAAVETVVTATTSGIKANVDPIYQQLRKKSASADAFSDDVATVNNLVLKRDAATFLLRSGEIYFLAPVEGRHTGAVFFGDGEIVLTPPIEVEKKALALFTTPTLTEQFTQLVIGFTDEFDEIKSFPQTSR